MSQATYLLVLHSHPAQIDSIYKEKKAQVDFILDSTVIPVAEPALKNLKEVGGGVST